ncbi:hypothetical protein [Micromonospora rubida]|uniref:hypothetical protein n=1 Tax=Micromonospora rubida TaxID=2697657 RepID=UPI0013778EB4|nr:hypothetical protein [Micromonospora rubida]NBE80291.1 hypothetical protein [Micromonospora rubida]
MEEQPKPRRGRPATGVTPKRNVRIGAAWDTAEQLAGQLGLTVTAYVEQAIREHNARVEKKLRQVPAE